MMKRFAEPIEVAQAVLWLASEASSFVTGAVIPVDEAIQPSKESKEIF